MTTIKQVFLFKNVNEKCITVDTVMCCPNVPDLLPKLLGVLPTINRQLSTPQGWPQLQRATSPNCRAPCGGG